MTIATTQFQALRWHQPPRKPGRNGRVPRSVTMLRVRRVQNIPGSASESAQKHGSQARTSKFEKKRDSATAALLEAWPREYKPRHRAASHQGSAAMVRTDALPRGSPSRPRNSSALASLRDRKALHLPPPASAPPWAPRAPHPPARPRLRVVLNPQIHGRRPQHTRPLIASAPVSLLPAPQSLPSNPPFPLRPHAPGRASLSTAPTDPGRSILSTISSC